MVFRTIAKTSLNRKAFRLLPNAAPNHALALRAAP
mgnify:CR=1 FL=1